MNTKVKFEYARKKDLMEIAKIEESYFQGYERIFDFEFLTKWFRHNREMFYIVKNAKNDILGFIIMVPINRKLYAALLDGKVSDLYDFKIEDVIRTNDSDYYYIADICVKKSKEYLRVAGTLFYETAKIIYKKAKYVLTSPITKEGLAMCKHLGFYKVSEQLYKGNYYPVYQLKVPEAGKPLLTLYEKMLRKI